MRAYAVVENGKPLQEIELPTPEPTGTEVLLEAKFQIRTYVKSPNPEGEASGT